MTDENRQPFCLQDTWQHVAVLYGMIVSLFGAPMEIAQMLILLRRTRHDILSWLAPVEALARRVLLLKALSLPAANYTPAPAQTGKLVIAFTDRPEPAHEAEDPAAWRVRFSVWTYGARGKAAEAPAIIVQRGGAVEFSAMALARRLEALRRVLENPAPAVARLSRLLAARRESAPVAFGPYRPPAGPVATVLRETQEQIALALNTS